MNPYVSDPDFALYQGDVLDVLRELPDESVHCVVTSPPYFNLRDYGVEGQIGLEPSVGEYVQKLVDVFSEVRRVLRRDGVVWLNLGDSFASVSGQGKQGSGQMADRAIVKARAQVVDQKRNDSAGSTAVRPPAEDGIAAKNLLMVPARVGIALQADGWWLRQDVIWSKSNALPESVTDRPASSHEHLLMLAKCARYHYDHEAVKEPAKWDRWGDQTTPKGNPGRASFIKPKGKQALLAEHAVGSSQRRVAGFNARWDEAETNGEIKPDRNLRSVWEIATEPNTWSACEECDSVFQTSLDADRHEQRTGHTLAPHFAAFPRKLVDTCLRSSCPDGGTVLDPFVGSGTTMLVARSRNLNSIGIELRPAYCRMIAARGQQLSLLAEGAA